MKPRRTPKKALLAAVLGLAGLAQAPCALALSPITREENEARQCFIPQYRHARYNPNYKVGPNTDCGPCSFSMALRALDAVPPGYEGPERNAALIRRVRVALTGSSRDGWTFPAQMRDAAPSFGLRARMVFGVEAIEAAMKPGRVFIANLNPSPAYAKVLTYPYDGGHFALVLGIDGQGVHLNDPLAHGPMVITRAQLGQALAAPLSPSIPAYGGGVMLWKRGD